MGYSDLATLVGASAAGASGLPLYSGTRLSASDYLSLPDDGFRYELIDGVVVMSPSPSRGHARIQWLLQGMLFEYLRDNSVGEAFTDNDVLFREGVVLRPDLFFIRSDRLPSDPERIDVIPDMVAEILSPATKGRDLTTKLAEYELAGVAEYWVIDPATRRVRVFAFDGVKLVEQQTAPDKFVSRAVPGFVLDIAALTRLMKP